MIGQDLGGRYEILTRIGGGGMALVYKAHDVLLNRKVAVKVLRQQFVHDEEFIRRFRREAQSAAALSHPNVVSIYDVGQEEDTHYIVMEYIEGHNLNEIIKESAPLQTDESVRIAMQIADALDHAHQNHIIHRDIKPHNILIGKNGRVKVTDFGIARAVTSSTITQTGSLIGSVHYFSPEHAKGINTGEKSDLYSLGIVLYQMLTAQLPFLGESPISVALKHLQENFDEPRTVNPHIPQSVENVILKAMRKNPGERYSSAHEMLLDLDTCLRPERLKEPKVSFTSINDFDETRVMPAIRGDIRPAAQAEREQPVNPNASEDKHWDEKDMAPKSKGWKKPLTVVGVTLLLLGLIIWGFIWLLGVLDVAEVDVPYVVGKTETEARQLIEAAGLKIEEPVIHEHNQEIPKDQVFSQTKMNMRVKEGSFIQISVSDGPELEELGNYIGKSLQTAIDELGALGITEEQIIIEPVFSEEAVDTIIQQSPKPGEQYNPESAEFNFMVSKGRETVPMPNLIGKRLDEAKDLIKANELTLDEPDILYEPSYLHQKDFVISQDPYKPKDLVSKGAKISIRVSSGPPADAKEHQFNINISPAEAGKTSEIRIVYSDARGENIEWDKRQITSTQTFPVTVIVAPDTEARVTVYRDNQFIDTRTITYDELMKGTNSSTLTIPGEEVQATEEPAQAEVTESNDEPIEEEQQQQP
ncbi:Stk1 family PASTA domain-containing Ser/Thr kinase [Paenibacillus sp. Soil522]|uniref:Stk1 family PASTA domain-containing Ser/Thr kinase n=1 Tax=Paenibacillus sp. Soil522 TaxID=1736388 RepID=UPI0006FB1D28|nr:Stk1 family PASTA domain-containing Ser/Thr kinase [Paenibacillus sp. Soil522]KRE39777.1 serine/threonine protein kinase [Paenibacillus sp. Soil522]